MIDGEKPTSMHDEPAPANPERDILRDLELSVHRIYWLPEPCPDPLCLICAKARRVRVKR